MRGFFGHLFISLYAKAPAARRFWSVVQAYGCSGFIVFDKNDAFGAGAGTAAGQSFFAGRHVEALNGDIAFVIEGIEVLRDGVAAGITGALSLLYTYFHGDIFQYRAITAVPEVLDACL
jgi:hypothetical protein